VEIKEFKEGVAFLAKLTNQRKAEPDPFMVQVDASGKISLLAGSEQSTYIWRTGMTSDVGRMKAGVPSKSLVQLSKTLKGKFNVSLNVSEKSLLVETSEGGSMSVPFVEEPMLARPVSRGQSVVIFKIDDIAGLAASIAATTQPKAAWNDVQIEGNFLSSTDSRKFFRRFIGGGFSLPRMTTHRATFWEPLSAAKTDGEGRIFDEGIWILAGNYEAFTGFVAGANYPDMVGRVYPEGSALDNIAVMDRKVLIGSLKAIGPSVEISVFQKMINLTDSTDRQVGLTAKQARGSSSIKFSSELMIDILSAMSGKEVIVAWKDDARQPLRIADSAKQSDVFLLAPIWKAV
jgi:hypothetical protein